MGSVNTTGIWNEKERKIRIKRSQADNSTVAAYINNMGGIPSVICNNITNGLILWRKTMQIIKAER